MSTVKAVASTSTHQCGVTTARCDHCTTELAWRGPADNPPVSARNNLRGHQCVARVPVAQREGRGAA